jgi:LacI family transcriptional regulator
MAEPTQQYHASYGRKRATIRDVARAAGVSYQTVSRVLNATGPVADGTRARVVRAIEDLGYEPDPVATSLATRQRHTLGIVSATFEGNACIQVLEGASAYAHDHDYQIVIAGEEHRSRSEPTGISLLKRQRLAGVLIIYHGSRDDNFRLLEDLPRSVPVVTTGYAFDRSDVVAVTVDTSSAAEEATRHLLAIGHRRIAVITGAHAAYETVQRDQGYRRAIEQAGRPVDEGLIVEGDWFVDSGYRAGMRLLDSGVEFTAVFAHSDRMAIGCIRAFRDRGLRIPEDVGVVGFNDISLARYVEPPLTTVRYAGYELGRVCAKALLALANGAASPADVVAEADRTILTPRLIVRSSCGARTGTPAA